VNALAEQVLQVAKQYLGPAAQQFLSKELRVLECTADTLTPWHLPALSERARLSASKIMDDERATEFGLRVAGLDAAAATAATTHPGPTHAGHPKPGGAPRAALDAAAKLHAGGKLRQAEEAYRQLALKYGDAESFRGLAETQVALEDVPAALLALRDGAVSLAKRGDRTAAIGLLSEAASMAPGDLAAHRRLAAAHANAGDSVAACAEYERFVHYVLAEGDSRRAWLELTYGRETLGDLPGLIRLVDRLVPGGAATMPIRANAPAAPVVPPAPAARPVPQRAAASQASPPPAQPPEVRRIVPAEPAAPQRMIVDDRPQTRPVGGRSAMVMADAHTMTSVDSFDDAPVDLAARIAPRTKDAQRIASQAAWKARPRVDIEATLATLTLGETPEQQAVAGAMRASVLIAARDPRATEAAIEAARWLLSVRKLQAASDLLLDYIAAGYTAREAQRLLIDVDCGLGRRDVARDKCRLLGQAYRLDGLIDTANDVERLASVI
jgi:tetratricopeptide (TPR) repeat protein